MPTRTRSQKLSESAWKAVSLRPSLSAEYQSRARSFPALIHHAGLCQALAFQAAKPPKEYGEDLAKVVGVSIEILRDQAMNVNVSGYMNLTRQVMDAAQWIRRSVDALTPGEADRAD